MRAARPLVLVLSLLLFACGFAPPPHGAQLARFEIAGPDGGIVGLAVLWEAKGAPGTWIEEVRVDDAKGRRAIQVDGVLEGGNSPERYAVRSRSLREVDEIETRLEDGEARWRRRKGLAVERGRVESAPPLLFTQALAPTDGPVGSLALWVALAPRLPLDGPAEVEWRALDVRRGQPVELFVSRRERRQVTIGGEARPAARFFVSTRAAGHTVWIDAETRELLFVDCVFGGLERPGLVLPERPLRARPDTVVERELKVRRGEVELVGTLSRPRVAAGPVPGVVLVHGSGAMDRDEAPFYVFRDLAHRLSAEGFAVARYDKRGVGESRFLGEDESVTREDLAADARAWLDALAGLPEIDGDCLFLVGHSEGGYLVPAVATGDPRVRGVVMIAGGVDPLFEVMKEQLQLLLGAHGLPPAQLEELARAQQATFRRLASPVESPESEDVATGDRKSVV